MYCNGIGVEKPFCDYVEGRGAYLMPPPHVGRHHQPPAARLRALRPIRLAPRLVPRSYLRLSCTLPAFEADRVRVMPYFSRLHPHQYRPSSSVRCINAWTI